jgi:hypothetical protein
MYEFLTLKWSFSEAFNKAFYSKISDFLVLESEWSFWSLKTGLNCTTKYKNNNWFLDFDAEYWFEQWMVLRPLNSQIVLSGSKWTYLNCIKHMGEWLGLENCFSD